MTSSREAIGQMGQIKGLEDLPSDEILISYIKEAVELNEKGIKLPSRPKNTERKELQIPEYLIAALEGNPQAAETFEKFSYSHKKEYIEWLTEAKTEETRNRRLATALEQMAEGKPRHWKYFSFLWLRRDWGLGIGDWSLGIRKSARFVQPESALAPAA